MRHLARLSILVLVVLLMPLAAVGQPGVIDTGFGVSGTLAIPDTGGPHWLGDIVAAPDGSSVIVGSEIGAGSGEQALWVAAIEADGSAFADLPAGVLGSAYEFASAVTLEADGSILLAGGFGQVGGESTRSFVGRLDSTGTPVPSFTNGPTALPDGFVQLIGDLPSHATSVVSENGDIVVGQWVDLASRRALSASTLSPTGSLSHGFIEPWRVGSTTYDAVDLHAFPAVSSATLVVGVGSDNGQIHAGSFLVESDPQEGTTAVTAFQGPASVSAIDAIRTRDADVVMAFVLTEGGSDYLHVYRFGPDGALEASADVFELTESDPTAAVVELRTGDIAVVTTDGMSAAYGVDVYPADLSSVATLTPAGTKSGLARAATVSPLDGGLLVAALGDSESVLEVTKIGGDESGRFVDDDGSVHEADIEAISEAGITFGCNPPANDNYCPDNPVTRAQMASFLTRALGLPPGNQSPFTDITASVHKNAIESIWTEGITIGCNPPANDNYCPNNPVTRAQMASFLVRALDL